MSEEQFANHSEEDIAILPDDFEMDQSNESEVDTTETETEQVDTQTEGTKQQENTQQEQELDFNPFLQEISKRAKYNKEPVTVESLDQVIENFQKGMNYDKVQEKLQQLESDPRLAFVEEQASQYNMTVEQYLNAVKEQQYQEQINELVQNNIPEEYAREMIENRQFREQYKQEQQKKQEEEQRNQEGIDFFNYFKEVNGKDFDPKTDSIPDEVWQLTETGIPLKFAYIQHENNKLKQQLQVTKQNNENKQKAPVKGVTNHGSSEVASKDPFEDGFDSTL